MLFFCCRGESDSEGNVALFSDHVLVSALVWA